MSENKTPGQINAEAYAASRGMMPISTSKDWESAAAAVRAPLLEVIVEMKSILENLTEDEGWDLEKINAILARANAELEKQT